MVHENLLARDFTVGSPNRAWAGDITYLWTKEGWLYLAVVLDIGTRRVIGWSLRETLQAELVMSALDMALGTRPITPGLICHSDRGCQYGSGDVQSMIERYRMRGSMSRKGNCWDPPWADRGGELLCDPEDGTGRRRPLGDACRGEERRCRLD
ncbi:MAG: DDE-type integrase/transposase/recombinase [Chloroflexi bacterium]|nr:DDE-type integrase/transposase/recombinase [Chloroflexota bacterium]